MSAATLLGPNLVFKKESISHFWMHFICSFNMYFKCHTSVITNPDSIPRTPLYIEKVSQHKEQGTDLTDMRLENGEFEF